MRSFIVEKESTAQPLVRSTQSKRLYLINGHLIVNETLILLIENEIIM